MPGGDRSGPMGNGPGTGRGFGGCVPRGSGAHVGRGFGRGRGFWQGVQGFFGYSSAQEEVGELKAEQQAISERLKELEAQKKEK